LPSSRQRRLAVEEKQESARQRALAAIARASDGPAVLVTQPELTHDVFVNALCQSLGLTPVEQQSLLDCDSIVDRYARLLEILEFRRLEQAHGQGRESRVH
jgi:Lon protease-like protein